MPSLLPETLREFLRRRGLHLLALLALVGLTVALVLLPVDWERFLGFGYLGVFVVTLLSSSTVIFPVPGEVFVFGAAALFNPLAVGIVASVGGTLGETTGYLVGYWGRKAVGEEYLKRYERAERWMRRYGSPTAFVFALAPFLLFDLVGIVAGTMKFPLWKLLFACWLGRLIRSIILAYIGWGSLHRFFS